MKPRNDARMNAKKAGEAPVTAAARFIVMAILAVAAAFPATAQNRRAVIDLESSVYRMMDALYLESGKALPSQARPWTEAEALTILARLDSETLSDAGKAAYRAIQDELDASRLYESGGFSFNASVRATPEAYLRFPLSKDPGAAEENYVWNHGYDERAPILDIPLEFRFGDSVFLFAGATLKEERATVDSAWRTDGSFADGVLGNYSNVLFDDPNPRLDIHFPFRAFMSAGGEHWNLQFGRDKLSWGNGNSGNLVLSDYPDFYDFISLTFLSDRFKMTNVYASFDPFLADAANTRLAMQAFVGHRLEARIGERFLVALNESLMLGDDTLEGDPVRDMNFMMVFHNWLLTERANSLLSLEFQANPWRYITLYGQAAMDEFTTSYEAAGDGGGGPPIFGFLAGAEGAYPLGPGHLSGSLECAITSPWLYNRKAFPYYYDVRRYWSLTTDEYEYVAKPIGYRYGPDALVFSLKSGYDVPNGLSCALDLLLVLKGEKDLGSTWAPAPGDAAPSGTVETSFVIHAGAEYPILSWLSAGGDLYFDFTRNRDHVEGAYRNDFEIALRMSAKWR